MPNLIKGLEPRRVNQIWVSDITYIATLEGWLYLAIILDDSGSAALRILAEHLGNLRDVVVGILSRPQASLADFYRELGHLFSVPLAPHNRWASAKALREKWFHHIENSLYRPVLLIAFSL